jgi:hypothetical protein
MSREQKRLIKKREENPATNLLFDVGKEHATLFSGLASQSGRPVLSNAVRKTKSKTTGAGSCQAVAPRCKATESVETSWNAEPFSWARET